MIHSKRGRTVPLMSVLFVLVGACGSSTSSTDASTPTDDASTEMCTIPDTTCPLDQPLSGAACDTRMTCNYPDPGGDEFLPSGRPARMVRMNRVPVDGRSTVPRQARTGFRFCPCLGATDDTVLTRNLCTSRQGDNTGLCAIGVDTVYHDAVVLPRRPDDAAGRLSVGAG